MKYFWNYVYKNFNLTILTNEEAVLSVTFGKNSLAEGKELKTPLIKKVISQFDEYFSGIRKSFDFPIKVKAKTDFQKIILEKLQGIYYGKTVSYKELALMCGNKHFTRAVGRACKNNPLVIIIPCHRVIKSNGQIGGYIGGEEQKMFLLNLEKGNSM